MFKFILQKVYYLVEGGKVQHGLSEHKADAPLPLVFPDRGEAKKFRD